MPMIQEGERQESLELNMAPMIDMVFLLIIFFLTATTFTERETEQDVLLPQDVKAGSLSRDADNKLIVNVMRDGTIKVFGNAVSPAELVNIVRDRKERARKPLKVMVRGDRRTTYGNVNVALRSIREGGVARPYLGKELQDLAE